MDFLKLNKVHPQKEKDLENSNVKSPKGEFESDSNKISSPTQFESNRILFKSKGNQILPII